MDNLLDLTVEPLFADTGKFPARKTPNRDDTRQAPSEVRCGEVSAVSFAATLA